MNRLLLGIALITVGAATTVASATDDPILTRKKLMQSNGGAAGAAQAMIKGEIPFHEAVAKASLRNFNAVAYSFGDYFPEGSAEGDTRASPRIWEEPEEFQESLMEFRSATDAARQAEPKSLEEFQAAFQEIGRNCQRCHEDFRLEDD